MSDVAAITEKLRDHAEVRDRPHGPAISCDDHFYGQAHIAVSILLEAADEIERLSEALREVRDKCAFYSTAKGIAVRALRDG